MITPQGECFSAAGCWWRVPETLVSQSVPELKCVGYFRVTGVELPVGEVRTVGGPRLKFDVSAVVIGRWTRHRFGHNRDSTEEKPFCVYRFVRDDHTLYIPLGALGVTALVICCEIILLNLSNNGVTGAPVFVEVLAPGACGGHIVVDLRNRL